MKRRIKSTFIFIAVISIFLTTAMLTLVFYGILKKQVFDDLRLSSQLVNGNLDDIPSSLKNLRITLVSRDGSVIFDSLASPENLENHISRPEISGAIEKGESMIVRKSDTLSESIFYYAHSCPDGKILRVGKRAKNVVAILISSIPVVAVTMIVLVVVSVILSHFLTKKIIGPIEKMADSLDSVDFAPGYEELLPFAKKIRSQHETILSNVNIRQEFTANISHELKTPLTAISGYAELIEGGMAEGNQTAHFASEIHRNAIRLLNLINDILKLSELDSSKKSEVLEQTDISEIAGSTVDMLQIEAKKCGVSMKFRDLRRDMGRIFISREHAQELCYNLVQNAIRYNRNGGSVEVSVDDWSLTVSDTGIGIPLGSQERIFERFYRVDKSRSKELGGTGLGLAIVKHIAEISGARISLESSPGVGTKISVIWQNYSERKLYLPGRP